MEMVADGAKKGDYWESQGRELGLASSQTNLWWLYSETNEKSQLNSSNFSTLFSEPAGLSRIWGYVFLRTLSRGNFKNCPETFHKNMTRIFRRYKQNQIGFQGQHSAYSHKLQIFEKIAWWGWKLTCFSSANIFLSAFCSKGLLCSNFFILLKKNYV